MAGPGALDLLVIGDLNPDIVVTGADVRPRFGQVEHLVEDTVLTIGGSAAITACAAARLGGSVALVAVVGDDVLGRLMLDLVRARGVDVSGCRIDPDVRTGASVILSEPGDRAILTSLGGLTRLTADMVPRTLLRRARHVHVSSVAILPALRAGLPDLFHEARQAETSTSFDPNWDPDERWDGLDALLGSADLVFPNAAEALAITAAGTATEAARQLRSRAAAAAHASARPTRPSRPPRPLTVVIKLGAAGALALEESGTMQVAAPAAAVVDTTGAGDTFNAGFLMALHRGGSLPDALRFGVACGTLSTRAIGGVDGQPTLDEATTLASALATGP